MATVGNPSKDPNSEPKFSNTGPDPFRPVTVPGDGRIMREFRANHVCPLCNDNHTYAAYLTAAVASPDELRQAGVEMIKGPEYMARHVARHAMEHHKEQGDFAARAPAMLASPHPATLEAASVVMTGEDRYTCDHCGRIFNPIAEHRLHSGLDLHRATRLPGPQGVPQCRTQ